MLLPSDLFVVTFSFVVTIHSKDLFCNVVEGYILRDAPYESISLLAAHSE